MKQGAKMFLMITLCIVWGIFPHLLHAKSDSVIDNAHVLSPGTERILEMRQADLYRQKSISMTTVLINGGSKSGAGYSALGKAPAVVLVIDVQNASAAWYTNGIETKSPVSRIENLWLSQGKNLKSWDQAISSSQSYAIGAAMAGKIKDSPKYEHHTTLLYGAFSILCLGVLISLYIWGRNILRPRRKSASKEG